MRDKSKVSSDKVQAEKKSRNILKVSNMGQLLGVEKIWNMRVKSNQDLLQLTILVYEKSFATKNGTDVWVGCKYIHTYAFR